MNYISKYEEDLAKLGSTINNMLWKTFY